MMRKRDQIRAKIGLYNDLTISLDECPTNRNDAESGNTHLDFVGMKKVCNIVGLGGKVYNIMPLWEEENRGSRRENLR